MPHLTNTGATTTLEAARPSEVEMDDTPTDDAAAPHQASAAKNTTNTRATGTRKTGSKAARTKTNASTGAHPTGITKVTTAGRRKKLFETSKAQAAYERLQDLKQAHSSVQKALKAPLTELADRTIAELLEDPRAIERTPQYAETREFLDSRLADQQRQVNDRHQIELEMARHVLDAEIEAVNRAHNDQIAELCHEAYGQLLHQLEILESLRDAGLSLDLPAGPQETPDYLYKQISQEESDNQGPFIETINGQYIPASGKPVSELMTKRDDITLAESPKRKAEEPPDDQPALKMPAFAKNGEAVPKMQRHPAGLLAAVEALEERSSETPPSNAPSPRPEPLDAPSPGNAEQARASGVTTPRDPLELPIPRGATSPDEYGVRLINRKATQMNVPNNRIMVPPPFQFEDHEIGFRDSTNSLQKGATKARRGRYLDKPNSNYIFIDRRVNNWDATNQDEFDEELIRKHRLHPNYGIVLSSSVNNWEPPKPVVSGWQPTVLVAPDGTQTHASRTIPAARLDQELQRVEDRIRFKANLSKFCKEQGIPELEVAPDPEYLREYRRKMLIARGMDPDQEIIPPAPVVEEEAAESSREPSLAPPSEKLAEFNGFVEEALQAASMIEADQTKAEEERAAAAAAAAASNSPGQQAQSSRPYDAIRDVFTDTSPSVQPSQPVMPMSTQEPPAPFMADTANLSCLADAAEQLSFSAPQPTTRPSQPVHVPNHGLIDSSAIDPSLFGPGNPDEAVARPGAFEQGDGVRSSDYPHPDGLPPPPPAMAGFVQQNENDFLRTTLNPQPSFPPAAGPGQEYPGAGPDYADSLSGRTPFSNPAVGPGNKALPALRPVRSLLNDSPPPPEGQESSGLQHPTMLPSTSGGFYPPIPDPNRPFHSSFSVQEYIPAQAPPQPGLGPQVTAAPLPHHYPGPATAQPPLAPGPPPPTSVYGSPPEYHNLPGPIAPMPMPMPLAPAAAPPHHGPVSMPPSVVAAPAAPGGPGPFMPTQGPNQSMTATPSPRSRPGSSSAASSSAAAKYRKLEPAPTPPHRMGYPGNGQELRTVQFDYREQIKDYSAKEAPPRHGPTHIRGWTHNNQSNIKKSSSASSSASRPTSKGDATAVGTAAAGGPGEEPS
ncbi:hypothetical protein V8F20_004582 [Naviculisporaceae sp. PSN 640]